MCNIGGISGVLGWFVMKKGGFWGEKGDLGANFGGNVGVGGNLGWIWSGFGG